MDKKSIPEQILRQLRLIQSKRPRTVIEHIIDHGHITTEELSVKYGYNHPPRAARDVRELGIPLETFKVRDSTGRSIGAYRFGDWSDLRSDRSRGRSASPKELKKSLMESSASRCAICLAQFEARYLQIDHRVPYEISGDSGEKDRETQDYMLLCSSCNRAKSWSCEHCRNWRESREQSACQSCYWASPEDYSHVAQTESRRLDVVWQGDETEEYDQASACSRATGIEMPDYVKSLLRNAIKARRED